MSQDETRFGPYQLLGELARGGMAEVLFAASIEHDGPLLALKRILPEYRDNPHYRRCFDAELELARAFHHPAVVEAVDAGELHGTPYLAMEYVHGRALNRLLHAIRLQGRKLPLPHACYVALRALEGLEHVHHAKDAEGRPLDTVVCNLSPSNVLVGWDGAVKLCDFGISTSRARFSEQFGMIKGKKSYMPPEQLQGLPLDARADVFAIGLCLIELITSEPAFSQKTEFEVEQALRSGVVDQLEDRLSALPPRAVEILRGALAPDAEGPLPDRLRVRRRAPPARPPRGRPRGRRRRARRRPRAPARPAPRPGRRPDLRGRVAAAVVRVEVGPGRHPGPARTSARAGPFWPSLRGACSCPRRSPRFPPPIFSARSSCSRSGSAPCPATSARWCWPPGAPTRR